MSEPTEAVQAALAEGELRHITLDAIRTDDTYRFTPGDVITGANSSQEVDEIETRAMLQVYPDIDGIKRDAVYPPLAAAIKPKRFHGDLRNVLATVRRPNKETILNMYPHSVSTEEEMDQLLDICVMLNIACDMYSTGKGIVGALQRDVLYTPITHDYRMYGRVRRHLMGRSQASRKGEALIIDLLVKKSGDEALRVTADGLRHILSGGLPGHGRRS